MSRTGVHAVRPHITACLSVVALFGIAPSPALGFSLTSSSFTPNGQMAAMYTCDGSDTARSRGFGDANAGVSPALKWDDPPAGTKSFALVVDDPDAPRGPWMHWLVYDIPAGTRELPEGMPKDEQLPDGSKQARNDFRNPFYQGPCPPKGSKPHHYVFTLYALDAQSELPAAVSASQLLRVIQKHKLGEAKLTGLYSR